MTTGSVVTLWLSVSGHGRFTASVPLRVGLFLGGSYVRSIYFFHYSLHFFPRLAFRAGHKLLRVFLLCSSGSCGACSSSHVVRGFRDVPSSWTDLWSVRIPCHWGGREDSRGPASTR